MTLRRVKLFTTEGTNVSWWVILENICKRVLLGVVRSMSGPH